MTAPNGWVLYIGRGDCRTDAERGELLGLPRSAASSTTPTRTSASAAAACTSGIPAAANGTLNSGITAAGKLAVYGDGGQGGERTDQGDHKMEYGLLGITVAPDFAETGHIYLQYFPCFNPDSTPPGLPLERRVSKMSQPRISRFTIDLETKQLDLDLGGPHLRVRRPDLQLLPRRRRHGLRLRGQPVRDDGRHELVAGLGRLLGQQPRRRSARPARTTRRQRPLRHRELLLPGRAPDRGQHERLQRQDAAVPADTDDPGRRSSRPSARARPTRCRRRVAERPEPVQRHRGRRRQGQARDLRHGPAQPVAAVRRPGDGRPVHGLGRPRRGRAERDAQGPSTYENAAQIDRAGNYGWPYCMGNGQAYRDRIGERQPRTDNAAGLRAPAGRPRAAPRAGTTATTSATTRPTTPAWSSSRTRPAPARTRASCAPSNIWYSRGNPGNANGCPDFPRQNGADSAPELRRHADPAVPVPHATRA